MDSFVLWASLAALALNVGCLAYNVRQLRRYYAMLAQVNELRALHVEICVGTWNMRHAPSAMRALFNERLRQIGNTEP